MINSTKFQEELLEQEEIKKKMKNKKADSSTLIGEHAVNSIIGVLAALILITLVTSAVIFVWIKYTEYKDPHLKQAVNQLNKIIIKANQVNENEEEETLDIYPPAKWFLRTFPDYDFPEGECQRKNSCLCICKDLNCEDKKSFKCEGSEFDVEVIGHGVEGTAPGDFASVGGIGEVVGGGTSTIDGIMKLDPVETLKIFKSGDTIKIKK